ncbi:MAG: hypothetical protein ACXVZ4_03030 [Gaiellaceae bacterium]
MLPIIMGLDTFFNLMVSWPQYLADWIDNIEAALGRVRRRGLARAGGPDARPARVGVRPSLTDRARSA